MFDEKESAPSWPVEEIDLDLVDDYEGNPNTMDDKTFSALVEEIAESGWLVPIQVAGPENGRYRMIGGHHRKKAARVLGYDKVPAIVVDPQVFDRDKQEVQAVKQNILHGELNPDKFTDLFNRLADKYGADLTRSMMGFTRTDAFKRVYNDAKRALPPEMAAKLEETRGELQSVDQLSLVLNKLFNEYGDTLDHHFMFLTWGGKQHLMIQLSNPTAWGKWKKFAQWCHEQGIMIDEELMSRFEWPKM